MNRENGFYWVKYRNEWEIAHWIDDCWIVLEDERYYLDSYWSEIDERRIERQPDEGSEETLNIIDKNYNIIGKIKYVPEKSDK